MSRPITPVVLAGGASTRLWPVSRDSLPKQFQRLVGPLSTYQQTLKRVADPARFRASVKPVYEKFRPSIGSDLLDKALAAVQ